MNRSRLSLNRLSRTLSAGYSAQFHASSLRSAITRYNMPAMSPTMTEGTITSWKKKEGDRFNTGDILLEVETDKAQIEVEAAEDGVIAKIIVPEGQKVPVNSLIALLAEEGDDLSNIEIPKSESAPEKQQKSANESVATSNPNSTQSTSTDTSKKLSSHTIDTSKTVKPLSPAVLSLLLQNHIDDPSKINATGPQGRILKGDVLAFLGRIQPRAPPKPTSNVPKDIRKAPVTSSKLETSSRKTEIPKIDIVERRVVLDELLKMCHAVNEEYNAKLSLKDFLSKAASFALSDIQSSPRSANPDEIDFLSAVVSPSFVPKPIISGHKNSFITSDILKNLTEKAQKAPISPEYHDISIPIPNVGTLDLNVSSNSSGSYPQDDFEYILNRNSSVSKRSSVSADLDFIAYLAGESTVPSVLFKDPAVEIQRSLSIRSGPRQVVLVKLKVDPRRADQKLAIKFLDRLDWYVKNPSVLVI